VILIKKFQDRTGYDTLAGGVPFAAITTGVLRKGRVGYSWSSKHTML